MNWIYNSMPDTTREVMVAFLMTPESDKEQNVHYLFTSTSRHAKNGWSAIPDEWTVLAWADFPRLKNDAAGKTITHHWITIEGLK
jgi:hypothetical protein